MFCGALILHNCIFLSFFWLLSCISFVAESKEAILQFEMHETSNFLLSYLCMKHHPEPKILLKMAMLVPDRWELILTKADLM